MSERVAPAPAEVIDRTRAWVRENFLYMRPEWPLDDDAPLLRGGVVDSVGVIELVAFLEEAFHVSIPEADITEEHLGTLAAIGHYVAERAP
jgi:acyl carrier protein